MFKKFITRKSQDQPEPATLARLDFIPYTAQELAIVLGGGEETRPDIFFPRQDRLDKPPAGPTMD